MFYPRDLFFYYFALTLTGCYKCINSCHPAVSSHLFSSTLYIQSMYGSGLGLKHTLVYVCTALYRLALLAVEKHGRGGLRRARNNTCTPPPLTHLHRLSPFPPQSHANLWHAAASPRRTVPGRHMWNMTRDRKRTQTNQLYEKKYMRLEGNSIQGGCTRSCQSQCQQCLAYGLFFFFLPFLMETCGKHYRRAPAPCDSPIRCRGSGGRSCS